MRENISIYAISHKGGFPGFPGVFPGGFQNGFSGGFPGDTGVGGPFGGKT